MDGMDHSMNTSAFMASGETSSDNGPSRRKIKRTVATLRRARFTHHYLSLESEEEEQDQKHRPSQRILILKREDCAAGTCDHSSEDQHVVKLATVQSESSTSGPLIVQKPRWTYGKGEHPGKDPKVLRWRQWEDETSSGSTSQPAQTTHATATAEASAVPSARTSRVMAKSTGRVFTFTATATATAQASVGPSAHATATSHAPAKLSRGSVCGASPALLQAMGLSGDRVYKCNYCSGTFDTRGELNAHVRVNHGLRHVCQLCKASFISLQGKRDHMRAYHLQAEHKFRCDQCGRSFQYASKLREHSSTHSAERVPCPACGKFFRDDTGVKKHMKEQHGSREGSEEFQCPLCDYKHHIKRYLRDHLRKTHKLTPQ